MKGKMNIANAVTLSRIAFAAAVLFSDTFSVKFFAFYLFLMPFGICIGSWQATEMMVIVVGAVATFAAIQEGHYIRTGREVE